MTALDRLRHPAAMHPHRGVPRKNVSTRDRGAALHTRLLRGRVTSMLADDFYHLLQKFPKTQKSSGDLKPPEAPAQRDAEAADGGTARGRAKPA